MTVAALSMAPEGEGALPAEVYDAIRGWKERARTEAQKKRDAIAERDELTKQLQVKRLEFDVLFAAVKCGRVSRRAKNEIREAIKLQMRWSEAELLAWEQEKAASLPTLEIS